MIVNKEDRILVVSPHPDDESIGCGGLLSKYRGQCDVLLVTDGYREDLDNKEVSVERVKEFVIATEFMGVKNTFMLHIPERKIIENKAKFSEVDFSSYKYIFVPNRFECHKDHADLYKVMKKVVKSKAPKAELVEYEVWTTLREHNIKVDISDVWEQKKQAIMMHKSQVEDLDYVGMILGLNSYRGKGHGCEFAEVYYSEQKAKASKRKNIKKRIKAIIGK